MRSMTVESVMTTDVATVRESATIRELVQLHPTGSADLAGRGGAVRLGGRVQTQSQKQILESFVRRVDGMVGVIDEIAFEHANRDVTPQPVARFY